MKTKKLAMLSSLLAVAIIASYVEFLIPIPFPVAGVKLGLSNAVTLAALYMFGLGSALSVGIFKVIISGLLFSSPISIAYGLSGTLLSVFVMYFLKKAKFGTVAVSAFGAIFHNLGQIVAAVFLLDTFSVLAYFPVPAICGALFGAVIGILALCIKKPLANFADTSEIKAFSKKDAVLAVIFAIIPFFMLLKNPTNEVLVRKDGEIIAAYDLKKDGRYEIKTEYGKNVLVIKNGTAYIEEADCNGGDCMNMKITENGGTIVCIPHRLTFEPSKKQKTDAIVG